MHSKTRDRGQASCASTRTWVWDPSTHVKARHSRTCNPRVVGRDPAPRNTQDTQTFSSQVSVTWFRGQRNLTPNPGKLSSIPRTHIKKGENRLHKRSERETTVQDPNISSCTHPPRLTIHHIPPDKVSITSQQHPGLKTKTSTCEPVGGFRIQAITKSNSAPKVQCARNCPVLTKESKGLSRWRRCTMSVDKDNRKTVTSAKLACHLREFPSKSQQESFSDTQNITLKGIWRSG